MRSIIIYCMCVLFRKVETPRRGVSTVFRTARYPILDAGCSNTRIRHRASSNKRLFIGLRCLLASLLLIVIPVFILNNLELIAVHAGQIPTIKKIYDMYGKQEMVEISINESEVNVVPGSKGKVYFIDTDDKSECIVASIEVTGDPKNGVVYAKITGKSNTINIKQGDYVKFMPKDEVKREITKSIETERTWYGQVMPELLKEAPQNYNEKKTKGGVGFLHGTQFGYITNKESWVKLWKAYRGENIPEVDFDKEMVLVSVGNTPKIMHILPLVDIAGNLEISLDRTTLELKKGDTCGYEFALIKREGIITIGGQPISDVNYIQGLLAEALMLYREGEYGEAVNKWGEVLIVDPKNLEAKFNIDIAKEKIKSLETTSQSGRKR